MPFKTILVSLNHVSSLDALVSASAKLAAKHEAHLIGLYVIPAVRIHPVTDGLVPPEIIDSFRKFFEEHSDKIKHTFNEMARKNGVSAEWRQVDSSSPNIADEVVQHGLQADLIVASQDDDASNDAVEDGFNESVVMESGRPVLLLPKGGTFKSIGDQVIIGWNASREAARATFDAMPLLETSTRTQIVWVDPQDSTESAGDLPGSELATTLSRHGIDCVAESISSNDQGSGAALLKQARDTDADLIVMGAYGHSRLREYIFGGVTRTMLDSMTVPVLMSR